MGAEPAVPSPQPRAGSARGHRPFVKEVGTGADESALPSALGERGSAEHTYSQAAVRWAAACSQGLCYVIAFALRQAATCLKTSEPDCLAKLLLTSAGVGNSARGSLTSGVQGAAYAAKLVGDVSPLPIHLFFLQVPA